MGLLRNSEHLWKLGICFPCLLAARSSTFSLFDWYSGVAGMLKFGIYHQQMEFVNFSSLILSARRTSCSWSSASHFCIMQDGDVRFSFPGLEFIKRCIDFQGNLKIDSDIKFWICFKSEIHICSVSTSLSLLFSISRLIISHFEKAMMIFDTSQVCYLLQFSIRRWLHIMNTSWVDQIVGDQLNKIIITLTYKMTIWPTSCKLLQNLLTFL